MSVLDDADVRLVTTSDDAFEMKRWLGERHDSPLALDTETTGLDKHRDRVRLAQFGDSRVGWAVPADDWRGLIREMVVAPVDWYAWNAKYDSTMLRRFCGAEPARLHDGYVLSHLDDPMALHSLKATAAREVDPRARGMDEMLHWEMAKRKWTWETVPIDFPPYWAYAGCDVVLTSATCAALHPRIVANGQQELYELELAASRVCAKMERRGVRIDAEYATKQVSVLEAEVAELRRRCKEEYGFELGQKEPIIRTLKAAGWEPGEWTETGQPSLSKVSLAGFGHPLARMYQAKEQKTRLAHTYFAKAVLIADENGRVHPDINPLQAKTGRMSISGLSMQNLPRNSYVRHMFVAGTGCHLLTADYAQIEMRLLVHFAREMRLAERFRSGADVPEFVARMMFGIPDDVECPKTLRQKIKSTLYSLIYGAGPAKIARVAGLEDGYDFLDRLYNMFPRIKWYQEEVQRRSVDRDPKRPWVESPRWRRRYYAPRPDKAYKLGNYLLQGEAGIAFKKALVALDMAGLDQYMVLPVHDEVVCDVPDEDLEDVAAVLAEYMPNQTDYLVPLTVEVAKPMENWGEKYVDFDEVPIAYDDEEEAA